MFFQNKLAEDYWQHLHKTGKDVVFNTQFKLGIALSHFSCPQTNTWDRVQEEKPKKPNFFPPCFLLACLFTFSFVELVLILLFS